LPLFVDLPQLDAFTQRLAQEDMTLAGGFKKIFFNRHQQTINWWSLRG
jgi:hypothetical protein